MNLPTLYHRGRTGAVIQWSVSTDGPRVVTEWGQVGGAIQTTSKLATTKNVGKKNTTTAEQQAELDAQSLWNHKHDREKYALTPEATEETVFLPMLAQTWEKKKAKVKYPLLTQPKLNGVRCLATSDGTLFSRKGTRYEVEHLSAAIRALNLPKDFILDGEIYIHGASLQYINSLIKKAKPGSEKLEYWLYDFPKLEQLERTCEQRLTELLYEITNAQRELPDNHIKLVPTTEVNSEAEVIHEHDKYVEDGYEGCIIRIPSGVYEFGHRSSNLLKLKDFTDDEFEIIGYKQGEGRYEGCVVWRCRTKDRQEFDSTPRGSIPQKREWYQNADSFIGKKLTVRYKDLSDSGIPLINVGICIRLDEDMPNE